MAIFPDYTKHDALGLAELVRTKKVMSRDLVDSALDRIDKLNPKINAVIHRFDELARSTATASLTGPFAGVPFLAKDLLSAWAGVPLESGSKLARGYVPKQDSEITKRYRAAGVVLVGKTSTPELGLVPTTEPEAFGPTRNPWDTTRTSGGSSGGAGAAVAAGLVPMAGGGDGGGSIRIPAAACGVYGLKPSRGRTPCGPENGDNWQGFVVEHVLTRSVRDSAAMLDSLTGSDPGELYFAPPHTRPFLQEVGAAPGKLRIAFTTRALLNADVHPDCVAAVKDAAKLLTDLGHDVVEEHPAMDANQFAMDFVTMLVGETAATVKDLEDQVGKRARRGDLEVSTAALALLGEAVSAMDMALAVRRLKRLGRQLQPFFARYDLLLTPTLAKPAVELGTLMPKGGEKKLLQIFATLGAGSLLEKLGALEQTAKKSWSFIPFAAPFNVTGQPAANIPLSWNAAGLPTGVQLVGRLFDDAAVLRVSAQLEAARPWANRRPPGFE